MFSMRRFSASALLVTIALSGCGKESSSENVGEEVSPNQFAAEMGMSPAEIASSAADRTVPEAQFKNYPLVVNVFRKSTKLPVLGAYLPEYANLGISEDVFKSLAAQEFTVVVLNGAVVKANIVSGAAERKVDGSFKTTPPGNFRLDPIMKTVRLPAEDGPSVPVSIPYPWLRSAAYGNSIMYWGLWMHGGYYIHSTPHYGELGQPASMGCVRQPYPDAMELFTLAQENRAMIRIYPIGSQRAFDRLREITNVGTILPMLLKSQANIANYMKANGREINTLGHAWPDPTTGAVVQPSFPMCGPIDCFKVWGKKEPVLTTTPALSELAQTNRSDF